MLWSTVWMQTGKWVDHLNCLFGCLTISQSICTASGYKLSRQQRKCQVRGFFVLVFKGQQRYCEKCLGHKGTLVLVNHLWQGKTWGDTVSPVRVMVISLMVLVMMIVMHWDVLLWPLLMLLFFSSLKVCVSAARTGLSCCRRKREKGHGSQPRLKTFFSFSRHTSLLEPVTSSTGRAQLSIWLSLWSLCLTLLFKTLFSC